jgi:N-acetylneuraminate 9-O-acetyltransferase
MHIDVHELRFRISLDVQAIYFGMLFAIGYVEFIHAQLVYPLLFTEQRKRMAQLIALLLASAAIVSYGIFVSQFTDKYAYNKWHALLSPLPILAFVVLRNATPLFRTHHSWLFAWLGRCSLETFILQYHIWLAADTKGLLRLGLCSDESLGGPCGRWCRWFEFWIITVFFLWTSWEVSRATNVLTGWIVGPARPEPVLGEVAEKNEGRAASIFTKANNKLGLKFRLATILAVLFIGNWMWT